MTEVGEAGTLDVLVTHDANLAAVAGYLLGQEITAANWPDFLEGLFLWRSPGGLSVAWRGTLQKAAWPGD